MVGLSSRLVATGISTLSFILFSQNKYILKSVIFKIYFPWDWGEEKDFV